MRVSPSTGLVLTVNSTLVKQFKSFPYLGSLIIIDVGAFKNVHTNI